MNMKLLIVDDDLPFRERLTRSMEKKGFDVTSSPGVKDSLDKVGVQKSISNNEKFFLFTKFFNLLILG